MESTEKGSEHIMEGRSHTMEADAHPEPVAICMTGTICYVYLTVQELVDRRRGNAAAAGVFASIIA